MGRSFGYASSPINDEPAIMQKGMPNPSRNLAAMYMPAVRRQYYPDKARRSLQLMERAWMSDATTIIHDPRKIEHRRP